MSRKISINIEERQIIQYKKRTERKSTVYKAIHRKLSEQHEAHSNLEVLQQNEL